MCSAHLHAHRQLRPYGRTPCARLGLAAAGGTPRPLQPGAARQVRIIQGSVAGIPMRFIDTPGLQPAASATSANARVLRDIRSAHNKYKPDIVLYFDRMDMVRAPRRGGRPWPLGPAQHARSSRRRPRPARLHARPRGTSGAQEPARGGQARRLAAARWGCRRGERAQERASLLARPAGAPARPRVSGARCCAQVRRDFGDLPLIKAITGALGGAMWFNAIVVLTHAAAAPPDNASGAMSYEMYASSRTHLLQQSIRRAPAAPLPPGRCARALRERRAAEVHAPRPPAMAGRPGARGRLTGGPAREQAGRGGHAPPQPGGARGEPPQLPPRRGGPRGAAGRAALAAAAAHAVPVVQGAPPGFCALAQPLRPHMHTLPWPPHDLPAPGAVRRAHSPRRHPRLGRSRPARSAPGRRGRRRRAPL